ncbi:MAG TPA: hypothetical protein DHW07_02380, partial [Gammaproteobacteria bacterium]|nr:hypothetical protein [Gammaproteobacteria bacterium]
MRREASSVNSSEITFSLDAAYYTSESIYQNERGDLFVRTWQYAGHVSQAAKPGDYFSFEIAGQGLFCI